MKRRLYRDDQAVSPVIAVILMVAITVVLAAVLYVWASSFLTQDKNAPLGSFSASKTDGEIWTVSVISMSPQVSVNSVNFYLLDTQGNTKESGKLSDIYGYYQGQGKGVTFMDNDFNGKLSPIDNFKIYPDEIGVGSVDDYSFRLKFAPTGGSIGYDINLQ